MEPLELQVLSERENSVREQQTPRVAIGSAVKAWAVKEQCNVRTMAACHSLGESEAFLVHQEVQEEVRATRNARLPCAAFNVIC
jgi:hypothetical protein